MGCHSVKLCPFSFDTRDKERQLQKEKKIKEMQKGEVPKFKALPVPHFGTVNLPEKKVKKLTQAEPFSLETDKRGAYKAEIRKHQLEEEQKQRGKLLASRLIQTPSSSKSPLFPRKRKISVAENLSGSLVQEPFQLATEKRAKERQEL